MRAAGRLTFSQADIRRSGEEEQGNRQSNAKRLHRNSIRRNLDSRFRVCKPAAIKSTCSCGEPLGGCGQPPRSEAPPRTSTLSQAIGRERPSYRSQVRTFLQEMNLVFWEDAGLTAVPRTVHVLHQPQDAHPLGVPRRGSETSGTTSSLLTAAAKQGRPSPAWPAGEFAEFSAAVAVV